MAIEHESDGQWERVAAGGRACRAAQQRTWGDTDNTTLGRYLAGEVSDDEREQVERALEELPDLRHLTDLVRDVLSDCAPAPELVPVAPVLLPFSPPKSKARDRSAGWALRRPALRRRAALVAAACLLLALGWFLPRPGASRDREMSSERSVALALHKTGNDVAMLRPWELAGPVNVAARPEDAGEQFVMFDALRRSVVSLDEPGDLRVKKRKAGREPHTKNVAMRRKMKPTELASAEAACRQANSLCQDALGPTHPATRWVVRSQANVYQVALNAPTPEDQDGPEAKKEQTITVLSPGGSGVASARIAPAALHSPHGPRSNAGQVASSLREVITKLGPTELRQEVVPVLIQALREGRPDERARLAQALGALGPAARGAVPALAECLRNASSTPERCAVLIALGKIGPAARTEVARCLTNRVGEPELRLAREVLRRLDGREGRVGIDDEGGCFTVRALQESAWAIRVLARCGGLEVLIETVPSLPADACCKAPVRHPGARSVHVLLARSSGARKAGDCPAVQVHVSPALRREGLSESALAEVLKARLRRRDYDGGLLEVVTRVVVFANETRAKR